MRAQSVLSTAFLAVLPVFQCAAVGFHGDEVLVRVHGDGVPPGVLIVAESEASYLLRQLGARVRWERYNRARAQTARAPECLGPANDVSVIEMLFLDRTPDNDHKGALGYALPFAHSGVRVVIFYDRIGVAASGPQLLAHVIAHELGHMLIGTTEHAPSGIMQSRWNPAEVRLLKVVPLRFTEDDAYMAAVHWKQQQRSCALYFP